MARSGVLDATALLAVLFNELGSDAVVRTLHHASVSAVNLCEVYTRMLQRAIDPDRAWQSLLDLGLEVCPFDLDQARIAGELAGQRRTNNLSLGDRACLALAIQRKSAVYTTNRTWKNLNLNVEIEVIR